MLLRDYQQASVEEIRANYRQGIARQLLVSPTGSGKTVLFSFATKNACDRGLRVWILAHRSEILDQISETLSAVGVSHGQIRSGTRGGDEQVQVASVQTLVRRLSKPGFNAPDLLIIDEAHHAAAGSWVQVMAACPNARVLGVTATPERLDGKGLGGFFDRLVMGPSVSTLIDRGFLAKPAYYQPPKGPVDTSNLHKIGGDFKRDETEALMDEPSITGDAVTHYKRLCPGQRAIAFCVSLKHCASVIAAFNAAGVPAATIDGSMDPEERRALKKSLSDGDLLILASCELVSEGYDLPAVCAAILLRPTASLALHLQQLGRPLRPSPGKDRAIILDHAGNCWKHGPAEEDREWTLEGHVAKKRKPQPHKQCMSCYAIFWGRVCPQCGAAPRGEGKEPRFVDGQLVATEADALALARKNRHQEERDCRSLEDFKAIARERNYSLAWAFMRWQKSWQRKVGMKHNALHPA